MEPSVTPTQAEPAKETVQYRMRWWILEVGCLVAVVGLGLGSWMIRPSHMQPEAAKQAAGPSASAAPSTAVAAATLTLAESKNYGNRYANGLLPVGDGKYSTTGAKKGSVYVCKANFVPAAQAGAQTRGPWFTNNNTQYDITKKAHVAGHVTWTPNMTMTLANGLRTIITNDLPNHYTGTFPVGANDPARAYDANPNSITAQSLTYALPGAPTAGQPGCVSGEAGVMLTGVALFDAFDAGGRDAGAWEVQDGCDGHPQDTGEYHYHTLSACVTNTKVDTVIGYALDGFPLTGPKVGDNNYLTTADLDECHGIISPVMIDGKKVTTYHYVMTQDFPYSVSCFRGKAVQPPRRTADDDNASLTAQGAGSPAARTPPPAVTPPPKQSPPAAGQHMN